MSTPIAAFSLLALLTLGPGPMAPAPAAQDVELLLEDYEDAVGDWKERLREVTGEVRRDLRKRHPAQDYWDRFDAYAQAGDGRALLWMATHLRDKGLGLGEVREQKPALYEQLFRQHASEPWFGEALDQLARERRQLEPAQSVAFYERTIEINEAPEVRAQAMYQLGQLLLDSKDEEQETAGNAWLKRVSEELPDTVYGSLAWGELNKPVVGKPAPDFAGKTIDGYEFRLSDYRGKVVLLDFYGFW